MLGIARSFFAGEAARCIGLCLAAGDKKKKNKKILLLRLARRSVDPFIAGVLTKNQNGNRRPGRKGGISRGKKNWRLGARSGREQTQK